MFMVEHQEEWMTHGRGVNPRRLFHVMLFIYFRSANGDPTDVGGTTLNNLLDGIQNVFTPDDPTENVCTLGGLVYRAWIEGKILKDPGDLEGQGLATVPIRILAP
jgi:hypothetical protein